MRAAGGFFTVTTASGKSFFCRARGILKRDGAALLVGDRVRFSPPSGIDGGEEGAGLVEDVLPRKNSLIRPPVANIDQLIIVMALKNPDLDWQLVSRLQVLAEKEGLSVITCLNKVDLVDPGENYLKKSGMEPYPYPLIFTSAREKKGIDLLREKLKDRCSVFAGPSGAGKSSLLNAVQPGLLLQTGALSAKIKRGRHTTRHAELLSLDFGGSVVDTPGFTRLTLKDIDKRELARCFPEFARPGENCSFRDCLHLSEPGCAVIPVIGNTVSPLRYQHYKYFNDEVKEEGGFPR